MYSLGGIQKLIVAAVSGALARSSCIADGVPFRE